MSKDCQQIRLTCVPDEIWKLIAEEKTRALKNNPRGKLSNERAIYNLIRKSVKS